MDLDLHRRILARRWFYELELPDGAVTDCYIPEAVRPIHSTRLAMLIGHLQERFGADWSDLRCLDLGCHEGYFSAALARRGCREVLGLDAREAHVEHARWIAEAWGLGALRFEPADVAALDPAPLGRFDVVLMFGLLYHVTDPIGLLRRARALTRHVCLIETQLAPELEGEIEWGSTDFRMPLRGCFALVDESVEVERGNAEASVARISLVPSLAGLLWSLRAVGFERVTVLTPPASAYEQFARGARAIVVAEGTRRRDPPQEPEPELDSSSAASSARPVRR